MQPIFFARVDRGGYSLRRFPEAPHSSGATMLLERHGEWIEGASGEHREFPITSRDLWRELLPLKTGDHLVGFMNQYGPLGRREQTGETYEASWVMLQPLVAQLQRLAVATECFDEQAFLAEAAGWPVVTQRLSFDPDGGLSVHFPRLADFVVYQMSNEVRGRSRGAGELVRRCRGCGKFFRIGGARQASRRADAIFCTKSCGSAFNKRRARSNSNSCAIAS